MNSQEAALRSEGFVRVVPERVECCWSGAL